MKYRLQSKAVPLIVAVFLLTLGTGASAAVSAVAAKTYVGFAFDVRAMAADGTVTAGPVAPAGINCSSSPQTNTNNAANVNVSGISLGAVTNTSAGTLSGGIQTTTSTFQATGVNIGLGVLTGLSADAITMTSVTTHNLADGAFTTSATMQVTNLSVTAAGVPLLQIASGTVNPNTGISIPGVAELLLNQQAILGDGINERGLLGTAVRLQLLNQTSTVGVGEVLSGFTPQPGQIVMVGAGMGAQVSVNGAITVGPLVIAGLPCFGSGGTDVSAVSAGGPLGGVASTGVITATANGTESGPNANATTSGEVAGANVLSGVITADNIKAIATLSTTDGAATVTPGHQSIFTNLNILGVGAVVNPAPNTVIDIPGVGWVLLNVQIENVAYADSQTIGLLAHLNLTNTDVGLAGAFIKFYADGGALAANQGVAPLATTVKGKGKASAKSLKEANALLKKLASPAGQSVLEKMGLSAGLGSATSLFK